MRIQEYWTTHGLATRRGFTYPVMWIPKTHVCGVVKTRMHCSRNPSVPRKLACSLCYHNDTTMWKQASTSHLSSRLTNNVSERERALSQQQIIGPMFFDTTVTSQVYIEHTGRHFQHLLWQPHFIQVWHANVNEHFPGLPSSGAHCIMHIYDLPQYSSNRGSWTSGGLCYPTRQPIGGFMGKSNETTFIIYI
jgi:hypothetical protein